MQWIESDTGRAILIVVSGAFFPCGDVTVCQSRASREPVLQTKVSTSFPLMFFCYLSSLF